jgi:hypothetical protein
MQNFHTSNVVCIDERPKFEAIIAAAASGEV